MRWRRSKATFAAISPLLLMFLPAQHVHRPRLGDKSFCGCGLGNPRLNPCVWLPKSLEWHRSCARPSQMTTSPATDEFACTLQLDSFMAGRSNQWGSLSCIGSTLRVYTRCSLRSWLSCMRVRDPELIVTRQAFGRHSCQPNSEKRFALLIDGDTVGPSTWESMATVVRQNGNLLCTKVFCPREFSSNNNWLQAASHTGVQFEHVDRTAGGAKDPNDMAIAMEAARLVSTGDVTSVALGVTDIDFVYIAQRLSALGHDTLVVVPEGSLLRLVHAFKNVGANIATFSNHEDGVHLPKKKFVLHLNGSGSMEDTTDDDFVECATDENSMAEFLAGLGYMDSLDDPLVPALAKLYKANNLGPLTVWPTLCSLCDAHRTIKGKNLSWKRNPGNWVFFHPKSNQRARKHQIQKYGSNQCFQYADGGVPFMLKDSKNLVTVFLRRMRYLDKAFNTDLGEAIDTFCRVCGNKRILSKMGLSIPPILSCHTKVSLLHGALVSSVTSGTWQQAPRDGGIRRKFVSLKLISTAHVPDGLMFEALQNYVRAHSLPRRRSYNGLLLEVLHSEQVTNGNRRK